MHSVATTDDARLRTRALRVALAPCAMRLTPCALRLAPHALRLTPRRAM
jgi:hypothetical protein